MASSSEAPPAVDPSSTAPPVEALVAVVASDPMPIDSSNAPAAVPAAADAKPSDAVEAPIVEKKEEEKKSSLDEQKLYQQVKVVLMNAELSTTTTRSVAEQLNLLFGYDFTDVDNKAMLKGVVARVLNERTETKAAVAKKKKDAGEEKKASPKKARTDTKRKKEESEDEEGDEDEEEGGEGEEEDDESEEEESEEKPKARRRKAPAAAAAAVAPKKKRRTPEGPSRGHEELLLSPALEKVVHVKFATRVDATKLIWEYIHGLDLVEGNFIACNDELKELFGEEKFRATQVEKKLTQHLMHKDGTPLVAPKKPKKEKDPNRKRSSIFSAEKILAQPLADLLGKERMSRGDVVKALHEYFKTHNLQDPNRRSIINFDPALEAVFHRKRTTFFKLNKLLTGKLMDPSEVM